MLPYTLPVEPEGYLLHAPVFWCSGWALVSSRRPKMWIYFTTHRECGKISVCPLGIAIMYVPLSAQACPIGSFDTGSPMPIQPQAPDLQRRLMSGNHGGGPLSKAGVTVVTRRALTSGFRVITATLDDVVRRPRGARDAIRPAQRADGRSTRDILNERLEVDLPGWTPVRDRRMGWQQCTPSSHATTPESNKSDGHMMKQLNRR
jgi:hypothetical protein